MLDQNKRYSVKGYRGVAFYFYGYPKKWEPWTSLQMDPETGEEYEEDTGEGEWVEDQANGRVLMVMVGDDRKHEVDESDCTPLDDGAYCPSCGQIGCTAYSNV